MMMNEEQQHDQFEEKEKETLLQQQQPLPSFSSSSSSPKVIKLLIPSMVNNTTTTTRSDGVKILHLPPQQSAQLRQQLAQQLAAQKQRQHQKQQQQPVSTSTSTTYQCQNSLGGGANSVNVNGQTNNSGSYGDYNDNDNDDHDQQMPNTATVHNYFTPSDNGGGGWRRCVRCGKKGIKDTFYGRQKQYCSLLCCRLTVSKTDYTCRRTRIYQRTVPEIRPTDNNCLRLTQQNEPNLSTCFEKFRFASPSAFQHLPLSKEWSTLTNSGVIVELCHNRLMNGVELLWFATIVGHAGYWCRVKLCGNEQRQYYVNAGIVNLYPLGYTLTEKDNNLSTFQWYRSPYSNQAKVVTQLKTLFTRDNNAVDNGNGNNDDHDHDDQSQSSSSSERQQPKFTGLKTNLLSLFQSELTTYYSSTLFEVIDKCAPSQMCTAKLLHQYGDWLLLQYDQERSHDPYSNYNTIWAHPRGGYVHPCGWSLMTGHPFVSTKNYLDCFWNAYNGSNKEAVLRRWTKFYDADSLRPAENLFKVGMKLEVLDPFDHVMRIGTVTRLLRVNYLMIKLEYDDKTLCFRHTSPHLYPAGFCEANNIPLLDSSGRFIRWSSKCTENLLATPECIPSRVTTCNDLKPGMILETFNLRGPGVVSYAVILRIIGRLLLIDFINHSTPHGLLVDMQSPSLYPVGYHRLVCYNQHHVLFDSFSVQHFQLRMRRLVKEIMQNSGNIPPEQIKKILCDNQSTARQQQQPLPPSPLITVPSPPSPPPQQQPSAQPITTQQTTFVPKQSTLQQVDTSAQVDPEIENLLTQAINWPRTDIWQFATTKLRHVKESFVQTRTAPRVKSRLWIVKSAQELENTLGRNEAEHFGDLCRRLDCFLKPIYIPPKAPKNIAQWSASDVSMFLLRNGMEKYMDKFKQLNIRGQQLLALSTSTDIITEKIIRPFGQVLRFRFLIEQLKNQINSSSSDPNYSTTTTAVYTTNVNNDNDKDNSSNMMMEDTNAAGKVDLTSAITTTTTASTSTDAKSVVIIKQPTTMTYSNNHQNQRFHPYQRRPLTAQQQQQRTTTTTTAGAGTGATATPAISRPIVQLKQIVEAN